MNTPSNRKFNSETELRASFERHLLLSEMFRSYQANEVLWTPATKAKRTFSSGLHYSPDVLSFPKLDDLQLSTRKFRLFLVLKCVFGPGKWLTESQWDFGTRLLRPLQVPSVFTERDRNPTESERAAEESLLFAVVLGYCLKHISPGEIPDWQFRQNLLSYISYATGYTTAFFRGKYFAYCGGYSGTLEKIQYSGKWSRRGRQRNRVRSASAVSSGNSAKQSVWHRTPRHLLLPADGGVPDGKFFVLDPFYLLGTVESAISDLHLLELNEGQFF